MPDFEKYGAYAAFIGRVLFASLFLVFGYRMLTAYPGAVRYMSSLGVPTPSLFVVIAIVVEIGGGLLIVVGYQTRAVAFLIGVYTLVAAFIGHFQFGDPNQFQHFMKNIALVGGSLALVACGGGAYSLDARHAAQPR